MSELTNRHRRGEFKESEILHIASKRDFLVNKFSWHQSKLRKITLRMLKDDKLKLVHFDGRNFYYRKNEDGQPTHV